MLHRGAACTSHVAAGQAEARIRQWPAGESARQGQLTQARSPRYAGSAAQEQPPAASSVPELVGPAHRVARALQARQQEAAAASQGTDSPGCSPPLAQLPVTSSHQALCARARRQECLHKTHAARQLLDACMQQLC